MDDRIDPWGSIQVKIDKKLIEKFGLKEFPENFNVSDHYLFTRKIIIAHRGFSKVLNCIKSNKNFLQVTGIASSGPLHLGHKVDVDAFLLMRDLGAKSYFVVSDIDAYVSRPDKKVPSMKKAKENAVKIVSHLLALGIRKDEIYVQSQKEPRYYEFAFELSKKITENKFSSTYGHVDPGKVSANLLQYADILHLQLDEYEGPQPTITGIGIEQDPHARTCREIARKLPYHIEPPSFFFFTHQSGLKEGSKMSASMPETAIFLDDNPKKAVKKIMKSVSGGRETLQEQKELGGIPEKDKAFEILKYHHPNNEFVDDIYKRYKSGELLSGELKKICAEFISEFLVAHQIKAKEFVETAEEIVYGKQ